ncbi:hypothetical protein [Croceicoccus sp. YJ47]|uniref:hypothetical protein n=1 Tax=Croceicoccus sp. YJ47 TaxID=2798724 RepID=UPI001921B5DC|nr:hypothetical protein [Croceicoccus sp. YJ47]QQN73042.1 hypothetical protein JD971_09060 [Croceicoccus sp. YJ47]
MRKIILAAAIAGSALTLTACSEGTEENAEMTADSMAADTEANMDAAGAEMEELGTETEMMADDVATDVDQAAAEAEADMQDETVAEAQAD